MLGLDIEGDGVTVGEPMSYSDMQPSGHFLIEQITSPRHGALESLVQGVADGTHKGVYLLLTSVRYPHTTVESPHFIVLFATGNRPLVRDPHQSGDHPLDIAHLRSV